MARTDKKVRYKPKGKGGDLTPATAAQGVEEALKVLEGRWKLLILFQLFGGKVLRFSDLERAIPAISQKMLIQQLRQMEADGVVRRIVYQQVPPKVEYRLTNWGQALCPALDALLKWAALRQKMSDTSDPPTGEPGAKKIPSRRVARPNDSPVAAPGAARYHQIRPDGSIAEWPSMLGHYKRFARRGRARPRRVPIRF